jgi:hypothetical protein
VLYCDDVQPHPHKIIRSTTLRGGSFFGLICLEPGDCKKTYKYGVVWQHSDLFPSQNCSKAACRSSCDAGTRYNDLCELLRGPFEETCNIVFALGGPVCYDFCNTWCTNE